MTKTLLARVLAGTALASLVVVRTAGAQDATETSADGVDAPVAEDVAATDVVEATWAARREYHRQLRSVDLSELGAAASSISLGVYALTKDGPFTRGLGGMTLAGGGVHLVSGIIYTIRSQRGLRPERAPDAFREGDPYARELEEAERKSDLFIAFLTTDASIITAGLTTALVGVQRERPTVQGVGIGLASQGVLTLLLDLMHQDQGRRYLRTLRGLDPRLSVTRSADGGATVIAGVAWAR